MKKLLISIKPKWTAKILNGEKTIEVRKSCPKCELPCEVYIYCTKDNKQYLIDKSVVSNGKYEAVSLADLKDKNKTACIKPYSKCVLNGKVVAKFTLNKVSKIFSMLYGADEDECAREHCYETRELDSDELLKRSCLTYEQMRSYLGCLDDEVGYAWHIDNLVIFDEPKELNDFGVKRSPQSWCYVEVNE